MNDFTCGEEISEFLCFFPQKNFYISGYKPPKKLLMFQEQTFQAQKIKKICSEKISGISRNETFYPQA